MILCWLCHVVWIAFSKGNSCYEICKDNDRRQCFYLTFAHAREIHQAVDEPAAPYNLRWGMSYDEARNTPLYSLEVSDINYAGKDPDLIISTLTPQEVGALKYQEMKLYFDKNKGLKSVFVSADVDSSQQAYKVDDGREALALYNEEVKVLDREYGPATIKEEFIADKGNSIKVFPPALQNSRSGIVKIRSE